MTDQSGLTSLYVSGTTAFATFANNSKHDSNNATVTSWASANSNKTGFLSFDLGVAYNIGGMAWFGFGDTSGSRITDIKVYADTDSSAMNGNTGLLFASGSFGVPAGSIPQSMQANDFTFSSAATTRYLTIEIVGNAGAGISGLGEVVFSQNVSAVLEPGTYALMGLGLLAIGCAKGRRLLLR